MSTFLLNPQPLYKYILSLGRHTQLLASALQAKLFVKRIKQVAIQMSYNILINRAFILGPMKREQWGEQYAAPI